MTPKPKEGHPQATTATKSAEFFLTSNGERAGATLLVTPDINAQKEFNCELPPNTLKLLSARLRGIRKSKTEWLVQIDDILLSCDIDPTDGPFGWFSVVSETFIVLLECDQAEALGDLFDWAERSRAYGQTTSLQVQWDED